MAQVNVARAKATLSELIERAEAGEEVIIARAGRPAVRLVPVGRGPARRTFGQYAGQIHMAADFDAPLAPAELAAFEGEE
jgi:prevent-host-death family protein